MSAPAHLRARRPGRRRRLLAVAATTTTLAMLAALADLLLGMGSATARFAGERITASQTANGQRDLLLFHQAVVRLALDGGVADAQLRRGLVLQQLDTLDRQLGGSPEIRALMREIRAVDLTGLRGDPAALRRVDAQLTAAERRFKATYDAGDHHFGQLIADAMLARQDAQRLLGALIVLSLLSAGAWTVAARRRSSGDLAEARDTIRTAEQRYQALVQGSSDLTLLVDARGAVTSATPAALPLTGLPPAALEGRWLADLVDAADRGTVRCALAELAATRGGHARIQVRGAHADGATRHLEATLANLLDHPDVGALVVNVRDVTERTRLEAQLSELAFRDPLTGLANRTLLHERLAHALAVARRRPDRGMALILLDLDDFKAVNDSLGHQEGDRLLRAVAERLDARVRAGDTVARLGGDEFLVLMEDAPDLAAATSLAEDLLADITQPLTIGGELLPVSASAGVRFVAGGGADADDLLRDADLAMYSAKGAGKGAWALYAPEMHACANDELSLRADLHQALANDELVLRYQPIVDVASRRIKGFEALVRWEHPTRGLLAPDRFIGLAEETGLIVELGAWVLHEATAAARRLGTATGRDDLTMSVNVSPRQLEADVPGVVRSALAASGLPAGRLTVELTETMMLAETQSVLDRLHAIRALGVRLALDDFGTGFASLGYLDRLPLDVLKVDRSFVAAVARDPSRTALVSTILELAGALGLRTVAEGVDAVEQLEVLAGLGCHDAQGYLFARPLQEAEAHALLVAGAPPARAVA